MACKSKIDNEIASRLNGFYVVVMSVAIICGDMASSGLTENLKYWTCACVLSGGQFTRTISIVIAALNTNSLNLDQSNNLRAFTFHRLHFSMEYLLAGTVGHLIQNILIW